jgi:RNA polymerase sigma-70 factor (ECF subfamily)
MLFSISLLRHALFAPAVACAERDSEHGLEQAARLQGIVQRHLDSAWRTARDLGVPPHEVEDVVQEVLVVIVRRLADIEADRERAFVVATTARVVANWRRTRRRRPEDLTESMDAIEPAWLGERVVPSTPEQSFERKQKLALLRRALDEMPEPQRVAFTLFELEQLTAREIAEQLGVAESAVFSRVRRAWVVFRSCCERYAGGDRHAGGERPPAVAAGAPDD